MPQDATASTASGRPRGRAVVDAVVDRSGAFRSARRHTALVRSMRLMLPVAAVLTLASYGLYMQRTIKFGFGDKTIEAGSFAISREALVAHDPRYTGFDKQGGAFEVKAKTAEQDLRQKGIVRLKGIESTMTDVSRNRTDMKAVRGVLDTNTNVLELAEKIDVNSQNGLTAELTQATIHTKENRIVSNEPVMVRMPAGTVRGQAMTIEQRERKVFFTGGVVANLKPQPKATTANGADLNQRGGQDGTVAARNDTPVDITSTRLSIDDNAKTATFVGNVVAKQNDQVLETTELEVFYDGQPAGLPASKAATPAKADPAAAQGKLRRLVAKSDVVLTRGQERATGSSGEFDAINDKATLFGPVVISGGVDRGATADRADIDNKTDAIVLTGNVVVTQQKNVLKGRLLQADRKQGKVQLSSPAIGTLAKGQISARLYQADSDAAGAKKKAPAPAAAKPGGIGMDLRGDPGQPIDIDSDTLDVDDKKKTAIFRGRVKAVQGDYVITTEELVATYAGDAGLALTPASGAPQSGAGQPPSQAIAGQPKTGAQLQSVVSPRRARITTKDGQRAEGDVVSFDPKANTARLTGNVVLVKGTEFTTAGNCAILDMNTGLMRLIDACGYTQSSAHPQVQGPPPATKAPVVPGGRAQVLLYPQKMKEQKGQAAKGETAATPAGSTATPSASPPASPATEPAPPRRANPSTESREGVGASAFGGN